ncbi:MAG: T9SS type A sorting domain-containing protein [Bacteroidetes bacterium]|nr:MAG: T9SS type A sorting domain-containing protein [Bacteroidota bacterium]
MKPTKQILILLFGALLLLPSKRLKAQMPDSSSTLAEWRQYIYAQLDSSSLLSGKPLLEMASNSEYFIEYQGSSNDSLGNKSSWYEMQNAIYEAIGTPSSMSIDSIQRYAGSLIFQDVIPVMGLSFDYATLDPQAWNNGLLDTQNMQVVQVGNQNPFLFKEVVSFAPAIDFIRSRNPQIVIPSQLFFSNKSQLPTSIQVYIDNIPQAGAAFDRIIPLPPNSLPPTDIQTYELELRVFYGSISKVSKFKIRVAGINGLNQNSFDAEVNLTTLTADVKISAQNKARGYAGIKFGRDHHGTTNTCIKKPIIIVEGIDFGTPENPTGCYNGKCGRLGFDDLINGNNPHYRQLANGPHFISEMNDKGYDVIYLDFEDGGNYMEDNAMVLVKLIQHINSIKCTNEELVVCGVSMGGIVAKYALSYMETNNLPHCVRTYASFDSPHQGANIPIGLQQTLYFAHYRLGSVAAQEGIDKLLRPATKQLLKYHVFAPNYLEHNERTLFLNKLQQLGNYPNKTRNVAIINGNPFGDHSGINSGEQIIDYEYHAIFKKFTIRAFAQTGRSYNGNDITFIADVLNNKVNYKAPNPSADIDRAPGGTDEKSLSLLSGPSHMDFVRSRIDGHLIKIRLGFIRTLNHPMCFIPSISALDVNTSNLYYNIYTNIHADNPDPAKTPFDAYFAPSKNEEHVYLSYVSATEPHALENSNIQWFIHEIEKSKIEIKGDLVSTYNYVYHYQNQLPGTTIKAGGHLVVNGNLPGGFNTYPSPTPKSHLTVYKTGCNQTVTIEKNGKLTVGDANENTGDLIFKKGSTLILLSGSTLTIHNGSKLVIEAGAKITYHPDAKILLEGPNAKLEIKGNLELMDAEFSFAHTTKTGGFVHFDVSAPNSGIIAKGTRNAIKLTGNSTVGIPDKVLEISGGMLQTPDMFSSMNNYLSKFEINNGDVLIHENSGFNPTTHTYLTNCTFEGLTTANSIGILTDKFPLMHFNRCWFKNLGTGISADLIPSYYPPVLSYVNFRNNVIGLQTQHGSLFAEHCEFVNNQIGWRASDLTNPGQATDCKFLNNSTGLEIESQVRTHFFTETCDFSNNNTGLLSMFPLNLTVRCTRFQWNDMAGIQTEGTLSLSGSVLMNKKTGGDNAFYNNNVGISINGELYLEGGNNVFMNDGQYASNDFISGVLTPCYPCPYMNSNWGVYANNNYWQPNVQTSLYVIASGVVYNSNITGVNNPIFTSSCFVLNDMGKPAFLNEGLEEMGKKETSLNVNSNPTSNLKLYPNPVQNFAMLDGLSPEVSYSINVIDAVGKSVLTTTSIGSSQKQLQLDNLTPGIYLVSVSFENNLKQFKIQVLR